MYIDKMYFIEPMAMGIFFSLFGFFLRKSSGFPDEGGRVMMRMIMRGGMCFALVSLVMLCVLSGKAPAWFTNTTASYILNGGFVLGFLSTMLFGVVLRKGHLRFAKVLAYSCITGLSISWNITMLSVPL